MSDGSYGGEYNSGAGEINGMPSGNGSYDPNDQSGSQSGSQLPAGGDWLQRDDVFDGDGQQDSKGKSTVKLAPVLPSGIGPTLPDGTPVADFEGYSPNGGENSSTVSVFDMNIKASLQMYDFLEAVTRLVPFYKTCSVSRGEAEYALRTAFRGVIDESAANEALLTRALDRVYSMQKRTPDGLRTIAAAIRRDVNKIFISGSTIQESFPELYANYDAWVSNVPYTKELIKNAATRARVAYDGVVRVGSVIRVAADHEALGYVREVEETPAVVRVRVAWLSAPDKNKLEAPSLETVTHYNIAESDANIGKVASVNGEIQVHRDPVFFYRNAFVREVGAPTEYKDFIKWAYNNRLHGQTLVDVRSLLMREGFVVIERVAGDAISLKKQDGTKEIAALPSGATKPESGTIVKTQEGDKVVE